MRLGGAFADVSNLDKDNRRLERNDRRRMAALGNRLWHSDATYMEVPVALGMLGMGQPPGPVRGPHDPPEPVIGAQRITAGRHEIEHARPPLCIDPGIGMGAADLVQQCGRDGPMVLQRALRSGATAAAGRSASRSASGPGRPIVGGNVG